MSKTFIQFYYHEYSAGRETRLLVNNQYVSAERPIFGKTCVISNGFSYHYSEVKKQGEILWVELDMTGTVDEIFEKNSRIELSVTQGTVYVSTYFNLHLYLAYCWAIKYPHLKFIVGGSVISQYQLKEKLPQNLHLTLEPLTHHLGQESTWDIDFPETDARNLFFGYTIDRFCYWGKCNFCTFSKDGKTAPVNFENLLKKTDPDKNYIIFLNTPAMTPRFIDEGLIQLPGKTNFKYWTNFRSDPLIIGKLKKAIPELLLKGHEGNNLSLLTGVEFPSNRMLSWMKKGVTTETILKGLELLANHRVQISFSLIYGWENLTREDVVEARAFLKEAARLTNSNAIIRIHSLAYKLSEGDVQTEDPVEFEQVQFIKGPFHFGYIKKLNEEQLRLNLEFYQDILDSGFRVIIDQRKDPFNDFL